MHAAIVAPRASTATSEVPQHMKALERANLVRIARAELKRGVARGRIDAAEVVEGPPGEAATMSVAELLTSQHRWGRTRTRRFLSGLGIAETRTLGALTERQRRQVALELAAHRAAHPVDGGGDRGR